ncbi:MAG: YecA family protein [Sodalis sp. (in: enterobacteria)]|uniref:YecA/YgfB family protein n=1 Tax=Sodalis sp. (in: enterobacteria) TaxID=1898979 RepID=UPI003F395D5E
MSKQNTFPDYENLNRLLAAQAVVLTAAEMHGLLSGILCGGKQNDGWQVLVHELTNDGLAFTQTLAGPLRELRQATATALADASFQFQLLLPADDDDGGALFARVDALAGWVNHFLLGLGVVQPQLDKVQGDVCEAIDDLRNIGQLGYDEDEDREKLAQSLEEVIEYVRMAAILCHNDFTRPDDDAAPAPAAPVLH